MRVDRVFEFAGRMVMPSGILHEQASPTLGVFVVPSVAIARDQIHDGLAIADIWLEVVVRVISTEMQPPARASIGSSVAKNQPPGELLFFIRNYDG